MTKATFKQEFVIENVTPNNEVSGYVNIVSSKTIHADLITGLIYFEVRGRLSSQRENLLTLELSQSQILPKNETFTLPFSFQLPKESIISYNGKNVSFSYSCDVIIMVNKTDSNTVDKSLAGKLKAIVTAEDDIKTTHYFDVDHKNGKYEVVEIKEKFNLQTNLIISLLFALLFGSLYTYYIPNFSILYIILGVILIFLLVFVSNQFIKGALGKVSLETLQNEKGFYCKIYKTKKFNLSHQTLYYEIVEEVTDARGSSSSTHTETIYTSEKKTLTDFRETSTIQFPYPEENGLQSITHQDVSLFWRVVLEGKYYGTKMKYQRSFKVIRA